MYIKACSTWSMRRVAIGVFSAVFLFVSTIGPIEASVDLHSHLFMKEGLGFIFKGDFFGPLKAKSWSDRFSSKANPQTLAQSKLKVVVVALYAHPLFVKDQRASIRKQISLARKLTQENPKFVLVRNPSEAEKAFKAGKTAIILGLEGALGVIENKRDLKEFIDELGIRIVTPIHFVDSNLGGAAFMRGFKKFANPLVALESLIFPQRSPAGIRVNPKGLGEKGAWLVRELIKRNVWIDFAHSSDLSQRHLFKITSQYDQPVLFTHTILRKFNQAERSISEEQLGWVRDTGGMIGLVPSHSMMKGESEQKICTNSFKLFIDHYQEARKFLPARSITLGSDFNGGIDHLSSHCSHSSKFGKAGFYHTGQIPKLWKEMHRLETSIPGSQTATAQNFLKTWKRVFGKPPRSKKVRISQKTNSNS